MLQPRKPLDLSGANDILKKERPPLDLSGAESVLKKKESTVQDLKSDSATPIGSSGGAGFPEIDTNSVAPGMGKQPTAKVVNTNPIPKLKEKPVVVNDKKETDFWDYLGENLNTGLATVSKSIYDAPGMVYDAAASITNPIAELLGADKSQLASSDKLAANLGFKNIPSDILKEKIKISNEKINAYSVKNGGDALTALENGNYSGAVKLITGTTVQSLPIMVAAMASGGSTPAMLAIGASTASTKNAQLKEENPEMALGTRITNATTSGVIEAVTGHLFTGASGAVMKKILAEKGVEAGSKIIAKSFKGTLQNVIEKNPFIAALGEVVEETAVEFGNQANDMASGIRTEFDIRAIKNAGLSATGMGGIQTVGVYGAKGYVKAKTYAKVKATNKEVFKLRSEIENGNLSDENKVLLGIRADRLEAENKKTLGTELEKVKALPTEQKTELNALNIEFEDLKSKFDAIDDADDIPANLKPAMKEELKLQASKNQKRKTEILSQNDGLEVKGDFSKFEGVEPDFDLENGKISSLPLKEQNRLNKLAIQELTNGDKTIEYTKEQVSETANKIYANEKLQTPTTETQQEAQPKAEEQKTSEADKVEQLRANEQVELKEALPNAELKADGKIDVEKLSEEDAVVYNKVYDKYDKLITPLLEEVVAPSVKQNEGVSTVVDNGIIDEKGNPKTFYHGSENEFEGDFKNNNPNIDGFWFSDSKENASTYGKNLKTVTLDIKNPLVIDAKGKKFTDDIEVEVLASYPNEKPYLTKISLGADEIVYMVKNGKRKNSFIEIADRDKYDGVVIKNFVDPALSSRSKELQTSVVAFNNKQIKQNEATPPTNTPTDGNVSVGTTNVGESGNAEQKSTAKESVSKPIDGGEGKGDVEVSEFAEFEKVVNESKTADEAFDKIKNIKGVSSETSKSFRDKYDPKGELTIKDAFNKFYKEVKGEDLDLDKRINALTEADKKKPIVIVNKIPALIGDEITYYKNGVFYKGKTKEAIVKIKGRGVEKPTKQEVKEAVEKLKSENKGSIFNIRQSVNFGDYVVIGDLVIKPSKISKEDAQFYVNARYGKNNESIDVASIKEDSKPTKGDLVDFGEGLEKVIDIVKTRDGKEWIKSKIADGSFDRENLYPVNEWGNIVSKQEEFFNRREESKKTQEERDAQQRLVEDKQKETQKEFDDIDGFAEDKTKIQKGKILQHLNKKVYRGTIKSELRRIANLPHRFIEKDGKKRVIYTEESGSELLLSDTYTTKTGLEYLQYLVDNKPTETPQPKSREVAGKIIEPHSEVNTDVETVKKELNLNEVDSLIYDEFKDTPKTEEDILKKLEKVNDNLYGKVEAIEKKLLDVEIKIEDNGIEVDQINDAENMTAAKKKKAVADKEKEFKDLQKQEKELQSQKDEVEQFIKDIDEKINDWNPEENISKVNAIVDKVNNRLETRKSIKEGTNLFPEDANIPEFVAVKKELIKLTDEKTIEDFNSRTAEQIEESKPIIKDIESKAENAERISKKELEKGIADAEKIISESKPTAKERVAERVKLSDAKIDANSEIVKAKLKAFTDMFPSADINPDDYKSNGFSAEAIVDMVAKAAKSIAKGAIVTSEHINEAIKAFNTHFDDEVDFDAVSEKVNPKESSIDLESFRDSWNLEPSSGEFNQYDSGNTIEREHGSPRNNQTYEVQKDLARVQIGIKAMQQAKELFGAEYVEKTLSFIEQANLSPEKKAVAYVLLENEMDARTKARPKDVGEQKLQDLVRAKSQAFLANSARAIGAGRFRVERFRELAKKGFSEEDFTNVVLTKNQIDDKEQIKKVITVTPDDVNAEADSQEENLSNNNDKKYTQEEFDRELQKAKEELGNDYNISVFENLKRQAKKDKLSDKKEDVKAAKAKVLEDIRKVVRESMGQMSANPFAKPIEFAALVTKLAKLNIQDGALSLEEVANNIYNDLKDMSKDISKDSILNVLKSKPKKVISESTKRKAYINLLNKNIESLDGQIAAKKRDVINKVDKYKNDAEIKGLRDTRTSKQEELAKVDPAYAESRKLATDLKLAQKSLDEYQRRINENDFSPKENQPKVIAETLRKLREERDKKRNEFSDKKKKYKESIKEPKTPLTAEELADKKLLNDVDKKINSLNNRISDLKANKQKDNTNKNSVWNDKISELETELKGLKDAKKEKNKKVTQKKELTEDEVYQRKVDQKIKQTEKEIQKLIDNKPVDNSNKSNVWSTELSKLKTQLEQLRKDKKEANPKEKSADQKAKEAVKQALIDKGFFREVKVKGEVKKYLDWKKLAGEEGSVQKIRKNVEEALAKSGYTKKQIGEMSDALEKEYVRLSGDVIEKGLRELKNRDAPRKPSELKSAAKKLAELNNYGLFEDNKDSYENIINSLLGINELDQKAFDGMREIADGYTTLMNSGFSEIAMKGAINELSRRQARLLGNYSFVTGSKRFKIMTALQEITNLSTRFKLVNLGNLAENVSSGIMARAYNNVTDMYLAKVKGEKRTTSELKSQTSKNARAKLKGIVFEASESYGDTSSMLLDHSMLEDKINESTSNKYVHALLSSYMGRPVLEGADSFNKILLTEAKIRNAASRILMAKGLNKREALDYISKALTGESMNDAKVKAKTLIDEVNTKAGKKILNDSQVSVESLASDIVKDALVSGGQMTVKELEAVYNSAYKSAGRDIGHVSNNSFTDMISANNAKIEKKVADAIKEKNWRNAAYFTGQKIIFRNFIYTFVGGGTNWFVKGLQKAGNPLSYISLYDDVRLRAGKELDITSDDGIKNMEKVLYRDMNVRSTAGTIVIGSLNALLMFSALKASGADEDLDEWLKENLWAKKFFDKMAPDVVVAMLAWENKEMGRYYSKMINQKPDFFDDTKNIQKVLDNYTKGYVEDDKSKVDKASGILGSLIGSRFDLPGPLKLAQDAKRVYKGAVKNEYEMVNYYSSGFWNGFLRGGVIEAAGFRPEPASPEGQKKSRKGVPGVPNFGRMKINP